MTGIADTGFLVALVNRGDLYHRWAVDLAPQFARPLLTCESVLSETTFHLGHPSIVLEMLKSGLVQVAFDCRDYLRDLEELARRFADRQPNFADLCLIRSSELDPEHPVVTIDRTDFRIYRRNRRAAIPILCPSA